MRQTQAPPLLAITIAGRQLSDSTAASLLEVRVRSRLGTPAQCVLSFDLANGAPPAPSLGDPLDVDVDGQTKRLFTGEVTAFEYVYAPDARQLLHVRGYDRLHRLRQRQAARVHEGATVAELAATLCEGTGLRVEAPDTPRRERLYQYGQSDLELLRDAAGRCGLYPVVDDGVLRLLGLEGSEKPELELQLGDSLLSARVDVNAEPGFERVRAVGWDAATAESTEAEAASSNAQAQVTRPPDPGAVGGGGERLLLDQGGRDEESTHSLAVATLDVLAAGRITASLVVDGDTRIRPGQRLLLRGLVPDLCGTYVVTDATHVADGDGYTTTVSTRPPSLPAPPAESVVTLGTVSAVADPDHLARVRVRLDAYGGLESGWVPVVYPAAGEAKGAMLLPDVGDRVAALLPHGDPDQALLLGGLVGTSSPPQDPVAGDRVRRWAIRMPEGQLLLFDADGKRLRLEGHNGSYIELGEDLMSITAKTDMVIEAPGRALTIKARSVAFEEA